MKKRESIYEKLINQEQINIEKYRTKENIDENISELVNALESYYFNDKIAIEEFLNYFSNHKYENIKDKFVAYLLSLDNFKEDKLRGLSILLMRDTNSVEAIKFGISLSEYYDLDNLNAAIKIIAELSVLDDFNEIGLLALKRTKIYPLAKDMVQRRRAEKENI